MTVIELDELGRPAELPLAMGEGRLLAASEVVTAVPSPYQPGIWHVAAAGQVGSPDRRHDRPHPAEGPGRPPPVPPWHALHGAAWQPGTVPVASAPDLVPAIAQALWRQTERALHQGLLPGYVTVEESSPVLRGRLRESVQLGARHGLPLPLEIRDDESTVDIPENQILRAACARMLPVPRVDDESARMLRRLLREFGDVSELPCGEPVPSWTPTRLNARCHDALRLGSLVLAATAVEHGAGNVAVNGFLIDMPTLFERFVMVAVNGFLIDMPTLFERFVMVAVREAPGGRLRRPRRRPAPHYFDQAAQVVLRPDIVWQAGGAPAAVIDAKYKAEKPAGYPNADLYQLLAYCTVLSLRVGHLVYARGNAEPARHVVRRSGTEIRCHAVDLNLDPEPLLSQLRDLAGAIANSAPP